MTDPALNFWLRHVSAEGGLSEPDGDSTYVVVPAALRDAYRLPEELHVTGDPDIARDEGVTLLAPGHPVLAEAAERVLASGDSGVLVLARPSSAPPSREVLQSALREAVPVDHGKIEVGEEPRVVVHMVVRVGALVTYDLSAEDHYQEQAEYWVDGPARRALTGDLPARLARAAAAPDASLEPPPAPDLWPAAAAAHRLIEAAATARREALATQLQGAHEAERTRAAAYYADAIAGIERRLATAQADRKHLLEQRLRTTREEESRRLAEIAEKYAGSHTIRPYRLHLVGVPALRLAADVRRGDRRYPMSFDWLLPAGVFAPVRCPSCDGEAPLVAGKQKLGCEACLTPHVPAPAAPPAKPAAPAKPAPPAKTAPPPKPAPAAPKKKASASQPVVPPHVRKEQRKAPGKLAEQLWNSVASGTANAPVEPGSPAAMLHRLIGGAGLLRVIGMPAGTFPVRYTSSPEGGALIAGALFDQDGRAYTYYLAHGDGRVTEVLPCKVLADGKFWNAYWYMGQRSMPAIAVPPRSGLDPVGRALLSIGPGWNGLPVTARALAGWCRLPSAQRGSLQRHDPHVMAAAVDRLVGYRAGGRDATFANAAYAYQADEQAIRQADRAVRPLLALGPDRAW